ncbi:MAG TPA: methionine biosynthesis protein MetW [Candidatus Competibacteraceae bacterium]|nr:methionine biosynthesis protein MetW [Candidatus Competibacteraceae bacterium]HRZ04984.1 methionine biosynthesis protein MetW [Candidatus Competibacteraceae bacterium]HSA45257.1 methionine biosynthesis protein MetW [Candidatus Competibacteraceae bacterium]
MQQDKEEEYGRAYARTQISRQRNLFRKFIKYFYVSRILRYIVGPSIDLGCGAGQILERLPSGSLGIEINPFLVDDLTQRGLRVIPATENQNRLSLEGVTPYEFNNLVLSHVLEHFNNADQVLCNLLHDCASLGISTVIIVVPGKTGFDSDPTHKTFIDMDYLRTRKMIDCEGFRIFHHSYFPGNMRIIGKYFIYHELMIVYRAASRGDK